MWLRNVLNFVLGRSKMNINLRVLRFFLFISVITLLLSSILALCGILATEDKMREMGKQLGDSARENVMNLVSEREKEYLEQLVHEKVLFIDSSMLESVAGDTKILAENVEDILSAQQNYLPKELIHSNSVEDGWSLSLALTPSAVGNLENLRDKIAMAANIQNNLKNIALSYDVPCSAYVAFEDGFDIVVDTDESDMRAHYFDNPKPYREFNFKERPWYKNAKQKNALIFNDTMLNSVVDNSDPIVVCSAPINVNGEFVGVSAMGFFVKDVAKVYLNNSIGKSGFWFLMNNHGQVIISSKNEGELSVRKGFPDLRYISTGSLTLMEEKNANGYLNLALAAEKISRGEKGLVPVFVDGEEYYLAFEPLQNVEWNFGALIKVDEVTALVDNVSKSIDLQTNDFISKTESFSLILLPAMAIAFIVLQLLVSMLSRGFTKSLVKPIQELSDGVREISSGNLNKKLEIHTGDEIEHLATCFNAMTDELQKYIKNLERETAARERLFTELSVSTKIQQSMLPHEFDFDRTDFEIYATMYAAKEVGGDFYDFYLLDENHLVVIIADVSGKSIPAALFMATSKTVLHNFALSMKNPDDFSAVMTLANQQLCHNNEEMMFVTVFMGMLDLKTGELIYVNGGHNPPLVCHKNKFEYLDVGKSCALGINEVLIFTQKKIKLAAGDIIFMYTDGVTEAMNEDGDLFSENYLHEIINKEDKTESLDVLLENIRRSIKKHAGNAEQSDDITMLALKFNGD